MTYRSDISPLVRQEVQTSREWLDKHVKNARHGGKVDATCPMCITIITAGNRIVRKVS